MTGRPVLQEAFQNGFYIGPALNDLNAQPIAKNI